MDEHFRMVLDQLGVLLFPVVLEKNLEEVVNISDGLILPSSFIDVLSKYYHDVPFPGKEYPYDEYELDKKIIDLFVKSGKSILGICGGLQTLNVYFGGTLYQNILNHKLLDGSKHRLIIESDSFLGSVYPKKRYK